MSDKGNGNFLNRAARRAQQKDGPQALAKVIVEIRQEVGGIKLHVTHPGMDPSQPRHATQIIDMLSSAIQVFSRKWVPQFEPKLIQEVTPKIEVVQG